MFNANPARNKNRLDERRLLLDHFGTVGGVDFDLRGANLPNDRWDWPRFLSERVPSHPGIFIAGDCESMMETLIGATVGELEREALQTAREAGMDILHPGDRAFAESIIAPINGDPFAMEPDQKVAIVSLSVTRRDGSVSTLKPFLVMRRGNMLDPNEDDTLIRLRDRLHSMADAPELGELSDRLEVQTATFHRTLAGLRPSTEPQGLLAGFEIPLAAAEFERALNLAALYGYQQGRAETERKMKAPAHQRLARLAADRSAAAKSAAARTKWQESVIKFAFEECERDPGISGSALARLIIAANNANRFGQLPQVVRLTELVRRWRAEGRLPPRT